MKTLKLICNCLIFAWFSFGINSAFGQKESQIDQTLSKYLDVQNNRIGFSGDGVKLEIIVHKNELLSKLGGNLPFGIYPQDPKTLFSKKIEVVFYFEIHDTGNITGLESRGKGRIDYFEKQYSGS